MYLTNDGHTTYRGGEQVRTRGLFLLFVQPPGVAGADMPIKCVVRQVALRQCGHWMVGCANIGGRWYPVSGAYGHDGLPMEVPQSTYDALEVTLPLDLYEQWCTGGGWNSAGAEAAAVREWALANLAALRA